AGVRGLSVCPGRILNGMMWTPPNRKSGEAMNLGHQWRAISTAGSSAPVGAAPWRPRRDPVEPRRPAGPPLCAIILAPSIMKLNPAGDEPADADIPALVKEIQS